MSITSEWQAKGGRAVLELLVERGGSLHISEIEPIIRERLQPTGEAIERVSNGFEKWWNYIGWGSTNLAAAGWLTKSGGGIWTITDAGRQALVQHPDPDEMRHLALQAYRASRPSKPSRKAWLVRGSSVLGENLVPSWLATAFVSLAASRLEGVPAAGQAKDAAEQAYAHLAYAERTEKVKELVDFVERMGEGDLVVANTGDQLFIGDVTGQLTFLASEDGRSNLRRAVAWRNPDTPVDYKELPAEVAAKLQGGGTVIELTGQLAELEQLLSALDDDDDANTSAVAVAPRHESLVPLHAEAVSELHLTVDWAKEFVELLNERRQLILYGPPGTGKTYLARQIAERLVPADQAKLIQFHPAYTYEDFFEGYRPVPGNEDGTLRFELRHGPFRKLVARAIEHPDQAFILIIDEINRANLAKVFGELYFLLEYRDIPVDPLYSTEALTLPRNLYLIGTMNSADRSIALLDSAMRRRFAFLALNPTEEPTKSALRKWLAATGKPDTTARLLDALNARIDDVDATIGPSYFFHRDQSRNRAELVWRTSILPLLREHYYGEWDQVKHRFDFGALWAEATADDTRT